MINIAQTNLQLFNQMIQCNYSLEDIEYTGLAYDLASKSFNCKYRGNGKPLLCHLIGSASILVYIRRPVKTVVAGLLHAAIGDADFGYRQPQEVIARTFGASLFELINAYIDLNYTYQIKWFSSFQTEHELDSNIKEAIIIRIANEVEDYIDGAINYYSDIENKGVKWRITYIKTVFPLLAALAKKVNQCELADLVYYIHKQLSESIETIPLNSCLRKSGKCFL